MKKKPKVLAYKHATTISKERLLLLLQKEEFKKEVKSVRKKWGIIKGEFRGNEKEFNIDIEKLLKKFDISRYSHKYIKEYLISSNIEPIPTSRVGIVLKEDPINKRKRRLFLEIYADTTTKDKVDWLSRPL